MRLDSASLSLCGLRSSDLAAIGTHGRVVGHVLRFERRDAMPHPIQITTQCRSHPALADVGSCTADENGFSRHRYQARDQRGPALVRNFESTFFSSSNNRPYSQSRSDSRFR